MSADSVVHSAAGFAVDTSAMTGESVPDHPTGGDDIFAGCFVVEGEARTHVVRTGAQTRLAAIATLTQAQRRAPTPLRLELTRESRVIAVVAMGVGAVIFGVALLVGMPASGGFLFAVGVTVAVVPEGLLPTVALSLAIGAQRMGQKQALVRHLEAVETLGSTTFICTDKTGTLTQNEMSVVEALTPCGSATINGIGYQPIATVQCVSPAVMSALRAMASAAVRRSSGRVREIDGSWQPQGDPMEAALDVFARRIGDESGGDSLGVELAKFPFDTRRRRMSVVVDNRILVKGAPDAVFPVCESGRGRP